MTSCIDDAFSGSRLSVIASAASGDTIDLSALTCCTITLQAGQIPIAMSALTLQGAASHSLAIRATGQPNRVLYQNPVRRSRSPISGIAGAHANYTGGCILRHGLDVESTILFGNGSPADAPSDFNAIGNFGVTGSNNVIGTAFHSVAALPGTITADPKLRPLSGNGGPTLTHAIASDSPARDAGTNAPNLVTDQRGLPRTAGAATDIGAYELQADLIFADGFD